jgi:hypothetical protein
MIEIVNAICRHGKERSMLSVSPYAETWLDVLRIRSPGRHEWVIYVGRAIPLYGLVASLLANPQKVGQGYSLADCLDDYRRLLTRPEYQGYRERRAEIDRLTAIYRKHGRLALVCWCAGPQGWTASEPNPPRCHAQIVAAEILSAMKCADGGQS